jgi:hypothetical protein
MADKVGLIAGGLVGAWWGWTHWCGYLSYTEVVPKVIATILPAAVFAADGLVLASAATGTLPNFPLFNLGSSGKSDSGGGWPGIQAMLQYVLILFIIDVGVFGFTFILNWMAIKAGISFQLIRAFVPALFGLGVKLAFGIPLTM